MADSRLNSPSHVRLVEVSVEDIAMVHAWIVNAEDDLKRMRSHRDHLMMLAKFNGATISQIARECDLSVQAVYQAIERTNAADESGEEGGV